MAKHGLSDCAVIGREQSDPGRRLRGRIPGREGLWEIETGRGRLRGIRPVGATLTAGTGAAAAPEGSPACGTHGEPLWMAPGFLDIQVNGFAGCDMNREGLTPDDVEAMVRALWPTGTALVLPTLVTGPFERLAAAARTIALVMERGDPAVRASIAGIHLEGPYISPEDGPRGAHAREFVRPPNWDEFRRLQEAAGGNIRLVTLAPEMPGALEFIEKAVQSGVVVAIGHTAASTAAIADAIFAGASLSTHLGNGAHAQIRRHPNYIWDQLAADELFASFIPDGFHLPPAVLKSFIRAKGISRSILITDAVALAGQPPGQYRTLGMDVELMPYGKVVLKGTEYLAGSALRLNDGVANAMRFAGVGLADAVAMVTANPAAVLGLSGRTGHLRTGMEANLTLFRTDGEGNIVVQTVVVAGQVVYTA